MGDLKTIEQEQELTFIEQGILGFEQYLNYKLAIYDEQTPFYLLTSLDNEEVSFIVMEPAFLVNDYSFDLSDEVAQALDIGREEEAFVLVLVTLPENPAEMTANLLGPLVFNHKTKRGQQIVLELSNYPVQYPLFPDGWPEEQGES